MTDLMRRRNRVILIITKTRCGPAVMLFVLLVTMPRFALAVADTPDYGPMTVAACVATAGFLARSLWEVLRREGMVRKSVPYGGSQNTSSLYDEFRKLDAVASTQAQISAAQSSIATSMAQMLQLLQHLDMRDEQIGELLKDRKAVFRDMFDLLNAIKTGQSLILDRQAALMGRMGFEPHGP